MLFVVQDVRVLPVGGQRGDLSQGGGGRCGRFQVSDRLGCGAAARGLWRLWALEGAARIRYKTQVFYLFYFFILITIGGFAESAVETVRNSDRGAQIGW